MDTVKLIWRNFRLLFVYWDGLKRVEKLFYSKILLTFFRRKRLLDFSYFGMFSFMLSKRNTSWELHNVVTTSLFQPTVFFFSKNLYWDRLSLSLVIIQRSSFKYYQILHIESLQNCCF